MNLIYQNMANKIYNGDLNPVDVFKGWCIIIKHTYRNESLSPQDKKDIYENMFLSESEVEQMAAILEKYAR